jgi:hypothetical protein
MAAKVVAKVPRVYILYENEAWLGPLTAALERRGVAYALWQLHTLSLDVTQPPPNDGARRLQCAMLPMPVCGAY